MHTYLGIARALIRKFRICEIIYVPRSKNKKADALSKLASCFDQPNVRFELVSHPATFVCEIFEVSQEPSSWMSSLIRYFTSGDTADRAKAAKLRNRALQYQLNDGVLYRKTYLGPLLRCVDPSEANYLIREIHAGICGIHTGPRAVVAKILNAGYYWPGMHASAEHELRKCFTCQKHAPLTIRPKNNLIPVYAAWPFQKWAIDIVGPLPEGVGRIKFLIVAVDYFTK